MVKEPEDRRGAGSPDRRRPVTLDLKAEEVKKAEAAGEQPGDQHVSEEPMKKGAASAAPHAGDARAADKAAAPDKAQEEDAVKKGTSSRGGDAGSAGKTAADAKASPEKMSAGTTSPTGPKAGEAPTASAAELNRKAESAKPGASGPAGPADKAPEKKKESERPIAASSDKTPPPRPQGAGAPGKSGPGFVPLLGAGLLGAVIALGGAYGLGLIGPGGMPGTGGSDEARIASLEEQLKAQTDSLSSAENDMRQRLDAMENQVSGGGSSDLRQEINRLEASIASLSEGGASGGTGSSAALEEVRARLSDLENAVASGTAPGGGGSDVDERLQSLSQEVEALKSAPSSASAETQDELSTISSRLEDVAGRVSTMEGAEPVDIAPLQEKIVANESAIAQLQSNVAAAATAENLAALKNSVEALSARIDEVATASERAAALAPGVAGQALTAALESGRPYEAELRTAASFGIEAPDALEAFAGSGLPSRAALVAEFRDIAPKLTQEANAPAPDASLVDRLKASALNLVEVRPAGPRAGDDAVSVTSRIEAALRSGDFDRALSEWKSLPEASRQASAEWGSKLEARVAGEELAARLRNESLTRLDAAG
ncbi:COG4223 family protein [Afifella sp. IM 167]|uniref:COG4223 family protein n=1 Tax=Afifella sp. IM 167 TaxID=2033586 RepID=UPI001CD01EED|nr:hypothetical protein [Afifella sp. IM 167]MBZ8134947.1 hypothetical protein [Afifella sp. IM 167]